MVKEYIPLFLDFNETTQDLTDDECGRLIRAIVDYANGTDYEERLTGAEKIAFRFMKGLVDRNQAISEARSKARSNANKQEQTETNENKIEQTETNENKVEETTTNFATKNQNQKPKPKTKTKTEGGGARFAPPTPEEVAEYCKERGNNVDVERFCDFYASKGWKVGNQPMKDWKACVRTWEHEDRARAAPGRLNTGQQKPPKTQQYGQRDYTGEQEAALNAFIQMNGGV